MPYQQAASTDTSNDGYDAVSAFKQRREIFLAVQELQRLEHERLKRISDVSTSKKKELLEILSQWLMDQTSYHSHHPEVESISGCQMQDWCALQIEAVGLQQEADRCEREFQAANNEYKSVAPMGHVGMGVINEWIADGPQKSRIQSLSATARMKATARDEAARRLTLNVEKRQGFGRRFLRGCLSNALDLEHSSVFGVRARHIVGEMTRTIESEWLGHVKFTASAMVTLNGNLSRLRCLYRIEGD